MVRYTKASSKSPSTNQLRDQFLRDLTREAEGIMKHFSQQFGEDLQSQSSQFLQGLLGDGSSSGTGSAGFSKLFTAGLRYLVSKPTVKSNTRESSRSAQTDAAFKLSQSQAMAEASAALSKGEKNL